MKHAPVPRPRISELYWYFASERQRSFEGRIAGKRWPLTADPIIQEYKFCNVYRAADRASQYLIRDVCYHDEECTAEDRLFQILAFRTFSEIETWRGVHRLLGHFPTLEDLDDGRLTRALEETKQRNGGLYTGAFILYAADAYGQSLKHLNHIELFRHMFLHDSLGKRILDATSLLEIYNLLHGYPLRGCSVRRISTVMRLYRTSSAPGSGSRPDSIQRPSPWNSSSHQSGESTIRCRKDPCSAWIRHADRP